jgi:hypothetical protein
VPISRSSSAKSRPRVQAFQSGRGALAWAVLGGMIGPPPQRGGVARSRVMWLMSDSEAVVFIVIVALMVALAALVS